MNYKLKCGTAKADITPPEGMMNGLDGLGLAPFAGVIDRLYL